MTKQDVHEYLKCTVCKYTANRTFAALRHQEKKNHPMLRIRETRDFLPSGYLADKILTETTSIN